ncbi:SRPBCC family protein [uncultured Chitinophaga sp.]|uniref:SRPBCC family protein n=1 Tax=uncultured Chitinophaga sp. TaxID=339340 RepID=UPI0025D885F2|nr:SRPBCC family protein [uncultured Chitinophaga sp.]
MIPDLIPSTPDCEITTTRVFNVPRELAFAAWANPDHLSNWWGPAGFTNTFNEFDFREGGKWNFIMHGPDQGNYANECEFIKIEKPASIAWKRFTKPLFLGAVTFEEVAPDKTEIVFKQIFSSADECNKVKAFAGDKNEENFDRLEQELGKMKG